MKKLQHQNKYFVKFVSV